MNPISDYQRQVPIEIVKRCPTCGEEFSQNYTPKSEIEWEQVKDAAGEDKACPKCLYVVGHCKTCERDDVPICPKCHKRCPHGFVSGTWLPCNCNSEAELANSP